MTTDDTALPQEFCWTKFGHEAGESPLAIRARKEIERRNNGGRFYWGIGSSIVPSLRALLARAAEPEVLFTPMLSRPSPRDESPHRIVRWLTGFDIDGERHEVGPSLVTSKASVQALPRRHFALVCHSETPIDRDHAPVSFAAETLANLVSGSRVGSSQVTSIVRRSGGGAENGPWYTVAFRARLVAPYFLTLVDPREGEGAGATALQARVRVSS